MSKYELRDLIRQEITVKGGAQQWADRRWDFAMSPQLPPSHRTHTERATHERIVQEVLAARSGPSSRETASSNLDKLWVEILRAGQPAGLSAHAK